MCDKAYSKIKENEYEKQILDMRMQGAMTEKEKEVLVNAKKEAQEIIKKSENEAMKNAESIIANAKEQNTKMIEEAKAVIENEKERMLSEIKSEVADLVVMATEKVIAEKLNSEKDREIIKSAINIQ